MRACALLWHASPQLGPYLLFVSDADEVVAPSMLSAIEADPVPLYNQWNANGNGFVHLGMEHRIFNWGFGLGTRDGEDAEWSKAFVATDALVEALKVRVLWGVCPARTPPPCVGPWRLRLTLWVCRA